MPPKKSKKKNLKRKAPDDVDTDATTISIQETNQHDTKVDTTTAADTTIDPEIYHTSHISETTPNFELQLPTTTDVSIPKPEDSIDTATTAAAIPQPISSNSKNIYDSIRYCVISNDGVHDHLIKLIGLKNLFAKMLPKMPKDYIVRLVMDKRHKSLAILSDDPAVQGGDDEIIGGICYRPYADMKFGEIAFCAVSMNQQVKVSIYTIMKNIFKKSAHTFPV